MYFRHDADILMSERRTVLILQKTDDEQFLCEIPVATSVPDATRELVELQNLRTRIHRYAEAKSQGRNDPRLSKSYNLALYCLSKTPDSSLSG